MNILSKFSVKRPIGTVMIMSIILSFCALSIMNLKMDLMPNMNIPVAIVMTTYNGAGPEEMENLITKPVEQAMGTVQGIDTISSSSSNGSSIVILQFQDDINIDNAALDMREKIDLMKGSLPDDASDPTVMKIDINSMSSIMIGVSSDTLSLVELKTLADEKIADRLERREGVASVSATGGIEREISITVEQDKLRGYGLSESTLAATLKAENLNIPTGSAKQGDKSMQVRVKGEFESLEDIRNLPITTSSGSTIYLRDVAAVEDTFKEKSSSVYVDNAHAVLLSIQKQSTANTVNVSDSVIKEMDSLIKDYPNAHFTMIYDPADYIRDSISNVFSSLLLGMALSVIVLYIFLRNFKSTMIVAIAMPLSVVVTIGLMYFFGITINLISLSGLTLGVGMLVDNSVVVLESIYRKIEEGEEAVHASIEGAREVGMSVTASTVTTVAAFLPITFVGGMIAQVFNDLSFTISFSLISSLIISLTFVPMGCSLFLKVEDTLGQYKRNNPLTRFFDRLGKGIVWLERSYRNLLAICIVKRKTTIAIALAFTLGTVVVLPSLGMELTPNMDQGMITASVEMHTGALIEETEAVGIEAMQRLSTIPEVDIIEMHIGSAGISLAGSSTDTVSMNIILVNSSERELSTQQVVDIMRAKVDNIPGAKITISASSASMGAVGGSTSAQIYVKGNETSENTRIANELKQLIATVEGVTEVSTSSEDTTPQATIKINRSKAAQYGISPAAISSYVTTAVSGSKATTYKIDGTEYDVTIRQDKNKVDYIVDIESILIPSATGINVPLSELGTIVIEDMPESITRENQESYVSVTADIEGRALGDVINDITLKLNDYIMPDGYYYEFTGTADQMDEVFGNLGFALVISILLIFMIMAAQFESLKDPLVVMFSIPIACTGGLFGLFVAGQSITMVAVLGLIMLVGVVVNNAIVLIDYTNLLVRERGMEIKEAFLLAGPTRMRPILMSTLTTIVSMLPLALGSGSGGEMSQGLAIVNVYGLALSTLVTLLVIPVIYLSFEDLKMKFKNFRNKKKKLDIVEA